MTDAVREFAAVAKSGLCTMNPQIGRWLRESWGQDMSLMNALPLSELVEKLMPECRELLHKHHTAGPDALLHRRLAYALYGLRHAPCRLNGGPHQKRAIIREDGTVVEECTLCGERF